ncbi:MAG TPA: radical SAM protein, partial [Candidatus Paceibacterota bacterium]
MLFANVKTEEDIEKLKKRIIKDPVFSIRLERVRKAMQYPKDGVLHTDKRGVGMRMPTKAEVLALYRELVEEGAEPVNLLAERALRKLKTKSNSGIAVVSLLTKPFPCPGRCTYCPTEENMPKSYLSKEPAAARALMNDFDPYLQITNRLKALEMNGHPVDKIEMIVIGGTWSFYHPAYQEEFLIGCYRACNDYGPGADSSTGASTELSRMSSGRDSRNEAYTDRLTYLLELQDRNEHARCRIIGLSIETRPDYITDFEIERLRALGVTKVEIGVQHLDDDVLKLTKRDMKIKQVKEATERLRNAGFKIVYHMMPNLPGSTKARDIAMFGELFSGEDFQPDMLKIYPCMVLEHSELYETWKKG